MSEYVFSVIVPVFDKWDLTRACLTSLREHTPSIPGLDFEVVVCDNASSDATATELDALGSALFGEAFTSLRFAENRNFGPACNAGARAARAPLLFFLNNDTLLTPNWTPPLLKAFAEDSSLGAAGPLLLYEDGKVQHLGVTLAPGGVTHLYRYFPGDHPVVFRPRKLQFITAAAMMLPARLFFACGGFHEGYRNGFEDVELSLRIRQAGKTLACVPQSVVFHLESQTSGRKGTESERYNSRLLGERCSMDMHIDMHHHGLQDGFQVFVDDFLSFSMRLSAGDEEALNRAVQDREPGEWLESMRANPYWVGGRQRVAAAFERRGHYAEALQMRAQLADILPLKEQYLDLLHLAVKLGDTDIQGMVEPRLQKMLRYYKYRNLTVLSINMVRKQARNGQDRLLTQLYDEKFKSMFPPK